MHESRSTLRVSDAAPISGRSEGSGASTSRSVASRSSGTAAISECTAALTSVHHAAAAALAVAKLIGTPEMFASVSSGTSRSDWA
jgi:hypothetical protein